MKPASAITAIFPGFLFNRDELLQINGRQNRPLFDIFDKDRSIDRLSFISCQFVEKRWPFQLVHVEINFWNRYLITNERIYGRCRSVVFGCKLVTNKVFTTTVWIRRIIWRGHEKEFLLPTWLALFSYVFITRLHRLSFVGCSFDWLVYLLVVVVCCSLSGVGWRVYQIFECRLRCSSIFDCCWILVVGCLLLGVGCWLLSLYDLYTNISFRVLKQGPWYDLLF